MSEIKKTLCNMCNRFCGMDVTVEDGRMTKVEGMLAHPLNKGSLCPKGLAAVQFEYDPQRLTHPLERAGKRGEGKWKRISWDEALDKVVARLQAAINQYGSESLCLYKGVGGGWESIWSYERRFMNVVGSPNYSVHSHLCYIPFQIGQVATLGAVAVPDFDKTNCAVLWGFNPFTSNLFSGSRILDAKERGAKLVVIDPRFTAASAKADLVLQPRPGTDGALALSMCRVILDENLYDANFVDEWTIGFDSLKQMLSGYAPEQMQTVTKVPATAIREAARLYACSPPACIEVGNGIEQHTNSVQSSRAIAILMAITGNVDRPGGNVFRISPKLADVQLYEKRRPDLQPVDRHPLFYKTWAVPGCDLVDALLDEKPYPIKAMITIAGNPVLALSDSERVKKALMKLDFLVVHELFMTATAELADIVLPAASCFEYSMFSTYAGPRMPVNQQLIAYRNKVVEPLGESRSDFELLFELGRKMGFEAYFPWKTAEEAFDEELKPEGLTIEQLKSQPEGVLKVFQPHELYRKYETRGFATPSRKIEIHASLLDEYGYDPLPNFVEPEESPISRPELSDQFPLTGSAAIKPVQYVHAQFRTVPWLKDIMPEPWVEIHPRKAAELGIANADPVIVESARGSVKVKAKFCEDIDPDQVFLPHGWGTPFAECNPDNTMTLGSVSCPISASTPNRSFLCSVTKA